MNASRIQALADATLSGSMPFPEIIGKLMAEGVEYYQVDYAARAMRFYDAEAGLITAPLTLASIGPIAGTFDKAALRAAIHDSQRNGQKFQDFSRRAVAAGVTGYFAFLIGLRVLYIGRQGDQHVEFFPGAGPDADRGALSDRGHH